VVVTHDIAFAYSIADKISILEDGKIILTGDKDAIKNSKNALLEPI
jgi:ABC-type transporter Mla maintaining outer membrane lipid asymmetry ATPase subunit MlaF